MFKRIKVFKAHIITDKFSEPTLRAAKLQRDARQLRTQYPGKLLIVQEWLDNQWIDRQELERA